MRTLILAGCFALWASACATTSPPGGESQNLTDMILISGGAYIPLYKENGRATRVRIEPFYLDKYQVTNGQFAEFIQANPSWQPENIPAIFADSSYLTELLTLQGEEGRNRPVTHVSWYAAMAYCKSVSKTLPDMDQWEYAARASDSSPVGIDNPDFKRKILEWYAQPATVALPDVQDTEANFWGVHGMHGVVWEHVSDFNNALVTGESREDTTLDKNLFCGSGAAQAVDPGDYAAFMRFALRGSYRAEYTLSSLGFRCALNPS